MFQPHSFLWHYLWVAPNLLSATLAVLMWRRGLYRQLRAFFAYLLFLFVEWSVLYPMDLLPTVPDADFWLALWVGLLIECAIVFLLISDIFAGVFRPYVAIAHSGKLLIRWGGAALLITATAVAAFAPIDNPNRIIPACHILTEAMYVVESGLLLLLFGSAAYFHLTWNRKIFGIAFGLGICSSIHLATWALMANGAFQDKRALLDMVNQMASHVEVLIWCYYVLVPQRESTKPAGPLPDSNLAVWNRELERLLQQ